MLYHIIIYHPLPNLYVVQNHWIKITVVEVMVVVVVIIITTTRVIITMIILF